MDLYHDCRLCVTCCTVLWLSLKRPGEMFEVEVEVEVEVVSRRASQETGLVRAPDLVAFRFDRSALRESWRLPYKEGGYLSSSGVRGKIRVRLQTLRYEGGCRNAC